STPEVLTEHISSVSNEIKTLEIRKGNSKLLDDIRSEMDKLAEQERKLARTSISRKENIGKRICKNGTSLYTYYLGIFLSEPQYKKIKEDGPLVGYLEKYSEDGSRIQFRVLGWATSTARLEYNPASTPKLDEFEIIPGTIYWDNVDKWFLCPK
ncbi:MAG: hypothetical protein P8163_07125, partial [Candidatus Thiodiazotropha sp.]